MGDAERQAVQRVLAAGVLTIGPEVEAFEAEFARAHGVAHAVAMANGTVALAALLLAHGIGPGDEVVVPSLTFISTATAVAHVGARPVFAEVEEQTLTLDPAHVAALLTPRTRAVIAVHYAGLPADVAALRAITDKAGLLLLEDAAEAHGATYRGRPVGGLGHGAMFSFTPTKNITTGEGGMATTDDPALARRLRELRNHGSADGDPRTAIGFNWRLTELQSALGRQQLRRLPHILTRKRDNAATLRNLLRHAAVTFPACPPDRTATHMLLTLRSATARDHILSGLRERGIDARIYFTPAHLDAVFAAERVRLPRTEHLARTIFSVPFHAQLTGEDLSTMAGAITELAPRTA
ncbi:perosamine synthetase [Crossiella equi]|uniref:Perosamine synthetase n=1 Tax=Crossiella equi TaxID=130796 RepID=A0ABS5A5Q9_9PSEU|nr:DegT/DnrJ/EryC1/StrS family aminotransferase [Crossiella equi]MBP2471931.1 perosamine synthetase [Crossiella equi]